MHKSNPPQPMAQSRKTVLTPQQMRTLLDTTAAQREYRDLHDAAKIMQRSGVRPAELASLRWTDFMFDLRVMRVEDRKIGGYRVTIMDPETVALLQQRRDSGHEGEFVMGSSPLRTLAGAARQYRNLALQLGLPKGGLHLLRRRRAGEPESPEVPTL